MIKLLKTHCANGHERIEENLIIYKDGRKRCRLCRRKIPTHCPKGHLHEEGNWYYNKRGDRHCKACRDIQTRENREKHSEKHIVYQNRAKVKKYGITLEEYNTLLEKQNFVCAVCKNEYPSDKQLAVDHDHKTNKVRGLLCNNCNVGIGMLNDSIETLEKAINYLKNNN